jgi:hypothetical protein
MRTKTLLLAAAAALAAGILSSSAQVYSANVVGYVNIPLTNNVLALVAPALDLDGTGTNNTVASLFPNPAIGDTVYSFNGVGYDGLTYKAQGSGHPVVFVTNWFNGVSVASNYPINPGKSVFYLPAANETNTQVGTVLQGTNLANKFFPAANAINLLSSQFPVPGGLTSVLGYNPSIGDTVYIYDNGGYDGFTYKVQGTGHPVVFTTNWFNGLTPGEPIIQVGEGFWLLPATTTNWVQSLTVQ